MDKNFKSVVIVLLIGILAALVAIYLKLPASAPTRGDFQKASVKQRKLLLMQIPLGFVYGGKISIEGSFD